ncbi:SGNH/GDSL hydrolase family protein [Flavilitoribacter nigricans]|uniref:Acetylhydrolase n=1 Tax=Flavilitoribacter nigricans (strain ATCC 23147 / DSM 23189 / NBRC 102662 / NCIMB 1420 / SS-2) TaxID=1122177 RepID=A0A2D0NC67_FLAN2|nr:SGNH/GDSL hydrolase family protein [Flavilitoribacter nigricans]PHN05988.1 acetylhydrolase [Flavilitoribacter nigricans DSM 23189 = NBRC 102662]
MKDLFLLFLLVLQVFCGFAQSTQWWDPTDQDFHTIEGQAWPDEVKAPYDRLPARAEGVVRDAVWNLSRHAAGQLIRFRSNAEKITVRYGVGSKNFGKTHMPATGVSGVDLYAISSDGQWLWTKGNRSFGDTVVYRFNGLKPNDGYHKFGREYRLYLPLYNSVEWLEIGVEEGDFFRPLPVRPEKPIVVYGTSIAHGACASRPGMAWTNILGRKMDRPMINLAFSGNGRLEEEVVSFLTEIDPEIYIVDCLPNLWNAELYDDAELSRRILESVRQLKKAHPEVPVLLTEHAGYTDGSMVPERQGLFTRVNDIQEKAFEQLRKEGLTEIHYLPYEDLNLGLDDMVDGTHPNDLGMMHYAEAYEKALRTILQEPTGAISTTQPCIQYREPGNYDWEDRHHEILERNRTHPPKMVILANSIVHFWGGEPKAKLARETESWEKGFTPMGLANYAYGWDRIENVLWRVYHGELDGFSAEKVLIMIGTNNMHLNTNQEIMDGLKLLVRAVQARQPDAEIVLMGILPRRDYEERIRQLNTGIEWLARTNGIRYNFIGDVFLQGDGKINEALFSDGLHPNKAGYLKMRGPLEEILKRP